MPSTEPADDVLSRKVAAMSTVTEPNGPNGASVEKPKPREPVGADKSIANIYAQNQIWKNKKLDEDKDFFKTLGAGHSPDFMWIGCSDARVPANEIMGEECGSVFVVRNVANLVVSTDFNLMAALQYAITVLKVPHIIVCGHYDCGGVRASMERKDTSPPLENWLRNIRDVYRLHRLELNAITDSEQRYRRLVELNVIEQCLNLFKTGVVQKQRVATYKEGGEYPTPQIHACCFDPNTGDMKRLMVKSMEFYDDLHDIYDLVTLGDEDVIKDKPHFPEDEVSCVASDLQAVATPSTEDVAGDKPLAPEKVLEV